MLPFQPQMNVSHFGRSSVPVSERPQPCSSDVHSPVTQRQQRIPVLRRASSWPLLSQSAIQTDVPPDSVRGDPQKVSPLLLEIDYAPAEEPAKWRRRHSERLQRRKRHPSRHAAPPLPLREGKGADQTDASSSDPPAKPVVREPVRAVDTAAAAPAAGQAATGGASVRRPTHGRSHSATIPAFAATAVELAVAVAQHRARPGQSRAPAAPPAEALPSSQQHQQLGFIPRSYPYRLRQGGEVGPSFVESGGGHSLVYGLDGYFPKPQQGQSLTEFLGSHDFKRNIAELDRENAHFRISESLIAAFEMVGSEMRMLTTRGPADGVSSPDTNIRQLRRQLTVGGDGRQRQPRVSDTSGSPSSCSGVSDGDAAELPAAGSPEPAGGVTAAPPRPASVSAPVTIPSSGSTPSPSVAAERGHRRSVTAENVALSLLSRFPEKQLPKASELVWLVGEDQVPQSLLPMPASVDPGLHSDSDSGRRQSDSKAARVTLRGTSEWAPPRAQIIFSIHKQGKRSAAMARQAHRCAGCGLKVSPQLANKFRWCEYLGRYFCANCHENQVFYIPARIIHKHDYNRYPVSLFSYQLLLSIWRDPLFHVNTINPSVLSYSDLHQCRLLRRKLSIAQKYVSSCRFAKQLLRTHPLPEAYLTEEIDLYSLRDLVEAGSRVLTNHLQQKYAAYLEHCRLCQLCAGRGHLCQRCACHRQSPRCACLRWLCAQAVRLCHQLCCGRAYHCEPCRHHRPIFPFEMPEVRQCEVCGACYHYLCYPERGGCVRCRRLQSRRVGGGQPVAEEERQQRRASDGGR